VYTTREQSPIERKCGARLSAAVYETKLIDELHSTKDHSEQLVMPIIPLEGRNSPRLAERF